MSHAGETLPSRPLPPDAKGRQEGEPKRVQRDADVFREVETSLIMTLDTAVALQKWFERFIPTLAEAQATRARLIAARAKTEEQPS